MKNKIKCLLKKILPNFILTKLKAYKSEKELRQQRHNFKLNNKKLLFLVDDILCKEEIPYWLNYGTLLGAYRDHRFIEHDYDMDVALDEKYMPLIKELMIKNGLNLKVEMCFGSWTNPLNVEYRFELDNVYIDFNFYKIEGKKAISYNPLFDREIPIGKVVKVCAERSISPFDGLSKFDFLGRVFYVPANTEEYIQANYGPHWRTPIKNYDYHDVCPNLETLSLDELPCYTKVYF